MPVSAADAARALRRRSCERKRRYSDEAQAAAFALGIMEREPGLRLNSYPCRFCGGWHLHKVKPGDSASLFKAKPARKAA